MRRFSFLPGVVAAVLVCGCGPSGKQAKKPDGKQKEPGEVTLKIMDFDETHKLIKSYRGKVVVLDCWSTTCDPCKREFPGLVKLHKKHGDEVVCISLSFDFYGGKVEDFREVVLKHLRDFGATFDNVLSSTPDTDLYGKLSEELGLPAEVAAVPIVMVFARDGSLAECYYEGKDGKKEFTYADDVAPRVAELLKQ